jgi:hypothetical protein
MFNTLSAKIAAAAVVATLGFPAAASACDDWNFGSSFIINQQNGFVITINKINREGKKFDASAKYTGMRGDAYGSITPAGRLKFNIEWDNGAVGIYTAFVDESGEVLDGRTYDKNHPASWSTWTTSPISCDD